MLINLSANPITRKALHNAAIQAAAHGNLWPKATGPEMVWTWYEALFPIDNSLSWRSLLGGFYVVSLRIIIFSLSGLTWFTHTHFNDACSGIRCSTTRWPDYVAMPVGPGHLRKDGKPRQHHLQQPRYSPLQRSLKLQLDMSRKMYLICPVSFLMLKTHWRCLNGTCIWETPLSCQMWYCV